MSEAKDFFIEINPKDIGQVLVTEQNGKRSTYPLVSDIDDIIERKKLFSAGKCFIGSFLSGVGMTEIFFIAHGDLLHFPNELSSLHINNLYDGLMIGIYGAVCYTASTFATKTIVEWGKIPIFKRSWDSFFANYFNDTST